MIPISFCIMASAFCMLHPETAEHNAVCSCARIRQTDGWCEKCKVGYLAGVKIESAVFFDALDAHGHDVDPATIRCDTCKKAFASFGYCDQCKIGFVGKQAFFSELTYYLARGKVTDIGKIRCETCLKNAQQQGWCERCRVGMVGFHVYDDKKDFEKAASARDLLISAIKLVKNCLTCALAATSNGTCEPCKATYKNGVQVPKAAP